MALRQINPSYFGTVQAAFQLKLKPIGPAPLR